MDEQQTCDHCDYTGDTDEFTPDGDINGDPTCCDCASLWSHNHDYAYC